MKLLLSKHARITDANPLRLAASSDSTDYDQCTMMAFPIDEAGIDNHTMSAFGHRINKSNGDENGTPLHAAVRSPVEENITILLEKVVSVGKKN